LVEKVTEIESGTARHGTAFSDCAVPLVEKVTEIESGAARHDTTR
jgi:hypothetical protein